ncbi:MAG: ComEC/Rec2 family competence protein, partial [Bryobacteraceae bacterium]
MVRPTLFSDGRDRFTLELAPHARATVSLAVRPGETAPDLDYGERVEIEARVRQPRNYRNPGEFDYRGFLAAQDIYWTASMQAGSVLKVLPGRCGVRALGWVYYVRGAAMKRLDNLYASDPFARGLLEAILLGERRRLEPGWQDDFRKAGTYHVLVVAGLHLAAFAGFLFLLLRVCFLREIPALAITTAAAWLYVLITGGSTPVLRAAGGFTLYLMARFFSRRGRVLNLLAFVALVFLIFDPRQLFDTGFQLSFLSVMSIGALGAPLIEATSGPFHRGLRKISEAARDLRLEPRIAQFRVELRLVAETIGLYLRLPARSIEKVLAAVVRLGLGAWEL